MEFVKFVGGSVLGAILMTVVYVLFVPVVVVGYLFEVFTRPDS